MWWRASWRGCAGWTWTGERTECDMYVAEGSGERRIVVRRGACGGAPRSIRVGRVCHRHSVGEPWIRLREPTTRIAGTDDVIRVPDFPFDVKLPLVAEPRLPPH